MGSDHKNVTRTFRRIDSLDDRKDTSAGEGNGLRQGRRAPGYSDDARVKAALDHVQVSGIGDITVGG